MKIANRINLLSILPTKGSFSDLIIIDDIKKKIILSQDEIKETEFKTIENGENSYFNWNNEKDIDKEINFTELETGIIKNVLKKMDEEKTLTFQFLELYKEFIK